MEIKTSISMGAPGNESAERIAIVPEEVMVKCADILGVEISGGYFRAAKILEQHEIAEIARLLVDSGVNVIDHFGRLRGEEGVCISKTGYYDDGDIEVARYLRGIPLAQRLKVENRFRGDKSPFKAKTSGINKSVDFGTGARNLDSLFCSNAGRAILEESDLKGFSFREVEILGKSDSESETWEIVANEKGPRVQNSFIGDEKVELFDYPEKGICMPYSPFLPIGYEYKKEDIDKMSFDFFEGYEEFGWTEVSRKSNLFVSQRFRMFCLRKEWNCHWFPIIEV